MSKQQVSSKRLNVWKIFLLSLITDIYKIQVPVRKIYKIPLLFTMNVSSFQLDIEKNRKIDVRKTQL